MIAWIDLETTGLDTECSVIEVACVVTDDKFREVARYQTLVGVEGQAFPVIEPYALEMHRKSGLWNLVMAEEKTIMQADRELGSLLAGIHTDGKFSPLVLGGQSVHFDRSFVERWMPLTKKSLSHRQIDVSGLKLMWSMTLGVPTEALPPDKGKTTHRAMDDILASIEAAKWYRNQIEFAARYESLKNS